MFQGQSYQQFKHFFGTSFTFCAQDPRQGPSRACPGFTRATDPALQRLLARAYPGASEDINVDLSHVFGRHFHLGGLAAVVHQPGDYCGGTASDCVPARSSPPARPGRHGRPHPRRPPFTAAVHSPQLGTPSTERSPVTATPT